MNTFRAIRSRDGRWTVERSNNGIVYIPTLGSYDTKGEALYVAYAMAKTELGLTLPNTDTPPPVFLE